MHIVNLSENRNSQRNEEVQNLTDDKFSFKHYGFPSLTHFIESFDNFRTWNLDLDKMYMTCEGPELAFGEQLEYNLYVPEPNLREKDRIRRQPACETVITIMIGRELSSDVQLACERALELNRKEVMLSRFAEQLKKINREYLWRAYGCLTFTNFVDSYLKEYTSKRRGPDVYISSKEPNMLPIEEQVVDSYLKTESFLCSNATPLIPMNR